MRNQLLSKAVTSVAVFFAPLFILSSLSFSASAETSELSLEQRIKHLEELNQTRNQVQADISYQLSELQREVRALTGQVEDNTFKLKQIQDRQRDLYRDIENRLSRLASQPAAGNANNIEASPKPPVKTTTISAKENSNAGREFEAAFAKVRNKNYDQAIVAFGDFLKKYPNSSYSANARYWMGQVYLVQNNLPDAESQFSLLISEFPDSSKAAAAKLKLGDIFLKQDKWAEAKVQYSDVANNSSGAQQQLARKGLDKIKKAGH